MGVRHPRGKIGTLYGALQVEENNHCSQVKFRCEQFLLPTRSTGQCFVASLGFSETETVDTFFADLQQIMSQN